MEHKISSNNCHTLCYGCAWAYGCTMYSKIRCVSSPSKAEFMYFTQTYSNHGSSSSSSSSSSTLITYDKRTCNIEI